MGVNGRGLKSAPALLRKLANCGRLLIGTLSKACLCTGADFLKVLGYHGCDDDLIISRLGNGSLNNIEKSEVLRSLCGLLRLFATEPPDWREISLFNTIREFLSVGIDPNQRGRCWVDHTFRSVNWDPYVPGLATPWQGYLLSVFVYFLNNSGLPQARLISISETVSLFISRGAKIDEEINVAFVIIKEGPWSFYTSKVGEVLDLLSIRNQESVEVVFVSIPAYAVIKIFYQVLRNRPSPSGQDRHRYEELLYTPESVSADYQRRSRVFGIIRVKWNPGVEFEYSLGRIDDGVGTLLGNRLEEAMQSHFPMIRATATWDDHLGDAGILGSKSPMRPIFESILKEESWNWVVNRLEVPDLFEGMQKVHRFWEEWLQELGLVTRLSKIKDLHSVREWVLKATAKTAPPFLLAQIK